MSDTDDSAVLVELVDESTEGSPPAEALQIVSIGNEDDSYAFHFHQQRLEDILAKVPAGWKVAVVSVLGAFRTGKSFLLSWFLRYLHIEEQGGDINNASPDKTPWYEQFQSLGNEGFDWRAGSERNTTGIWMWSQPYFLRNDKAEHPTAVLLIDTQGMFDHETTMALTASIFGFSTLLSSYQIYNVDKRIQEDNLQQLALFSEYARTAMTSEASERTVVEDDSKVDFRSVDDTEDDEIASVRKPFQQIDFLVRDWQHFEEEDEGNYAAMEKTMDEYLEKVIAERDAKDLQETREQITSCFETISCYGMCHPGFAVTKKKFTGDVHTLETTFLHLLDRYCQRVFKNVKPKMIGGRELTAVELGTYISAYAELFRSGAKFPTAATILEATTSANNTSAIHLGYSHYTMRMDRISGPHCSNYIRPEELQQEHEQIRAEALKEFEQVATFGGKKSIDESRDKLLLQVETQHETYKSLNEGRNPLAGWETYLLPTFVAVASFVLRWIVDFTCSSYSATCKVASNQLSHVHAVGFCFVFIVAATKAKQIQQVFKRFLTAASVIMDSGGKGQPQRVKME